MDFSDLDILDEFFGMGDDSNPLMMLIWILPIILFVFYGQRIQLIITSSDIKKKLGQLEQFRNDSRSALIEYIKKDLAVKDDITQKLDRIFDYFTIMPIDIDPNGIIPKIHRLIRSREDTTRKQVQSLLSEIDTMEMDSMSDEDFQTKVKQKLLGVMTNNGSKHKVIPLEDIEHYIAQGWEYVNALPNDRAILKIPF